MRRREKAAPFQVGDLVTTDFYPSDSHVVRKVTRVEKSDKYGSGWCVSANFGIPCPTCGRAARSDVTQVDSAWFRKVEHTQKE